MGKYRAYAIKSELVIKAQSEEEAERIAEEIVNIKLPSRISKHLLNWSYENAEDITDEIDIEPGELDTL